MDRLGITGLFLFNHYANLLKVKLIPGRFCGAAVFIVGHIWSELTKGCNLC